MRKIFLVIIINFILLPAVFAQSKTLIGILPFTSSAQNNYYSRNSGDQYTAAIENEVSDAFLKTKRFTLVEREKMNQIKSEKELQKNPDFIDGKVVEQSAALGAQFIVTGDITKASVENKIVTLPIVGATSTSVADISFSIKVIDVASSVIIASNSFSGSGKGKKAADDALKEIKPEIEKFIKDNFKLTVSIAQVEEKNASGAAVKVLIAAGSASGIKEKNELKVYEISELPVDGKKLVRKKTIGKLIVNSVEDENFSMCGVQDGGAEIAAKIASGAKIKCEIVNE